MQGLTLAAIISVEKQTLMLGSMQKLQQSLEHGQGHRVIVQVLTLTAIIAAEKHTLKARVDVKL